MSVHITTEAMVGSGFLLDLLLEVCTSLLARSPSVETNTIVLVFGKACNLDSLKVAKFKAPQVGKKLKSNKPHLFYDRLKVIFWPQEYLRGKKKRYWLGEHENHEW